MLSWCVLAYSRGRDLLSRCNLFKGFSETCHSQVHRPHCPGLQDLPVVPAHTRALQLGAGPSSVLMALCAAAPRV